MPGLTQKIHETMPQAMTLKEFLAWPGDGENGRNQLVDGEIRAMAPASFTHAIIQSNLARQLGNHLDTQGNPCRTATEPGVEVRVKAQYNLRVPDIGVSCAPDRPGEVALADPILLIEILSPGNPKDTWRNVWAYTTIPTVMEILVLHSFNIHAELLRREADGSWPKETEQIGADGVLRLTSIEFEAPLRDVYAKTYLA